MDEKTTIMQRKHLHRRLLRGFYLILMVIVVGILSMNTVNSFEFDNIKGYDSNTKTVTVTNAFGLGGKIANITLNTPNIYYVMVGKNRKVAEFTIKNKDNYNFENIFNKLELYKKDGMIKINREFTYKQKNITYEIADAYKTVCNIIEDKESLFYNTTECKGVLVSNSLKEIINWIDLDLKSTLGKGEITIGIFTDVKSGDNIEWIPTFYGVEIDEWATWTEGLNVDLDGYWKFDGDTTNSVNSSYDGVNNGAITFPDAKINQGVYQNWGAKKGVNVSLTASNNFRYGSNPFTFAFWFNMSATEMSLFGTYQDGTDDGWMLYNTANKITLRNGGDLSLSSTTTIVANTMYHIAFTRNASSFGIFINGVSEATGIADADLNQIDPLEALTFNGGFYTPALIGTIDELGIWSRALSSSEISDLYNGGTGISYIEADVTPPNINITYPSNDTNTSNTNLNINYTANDDTALDNCWYSNDSYTSNTTLADCGTNITSIIWVEGVHNVRVYANDTEGNENVSHIKFTVDTITPDLNITSPLNNSLSPSTLDILFNRVDTNLAYCWYSNDTYSVNTTLADCSVNITTIIWVDGNHNVRVYVNDSAGNENSSSVSFNVDSLVPNLNITSPSNNTNSSDNTLDILFDKSDTNLASCWYSNDTMNYNTTLASCGNITTIIWVDGNHNVRVYANDTYGNENSSSVSFTIDTSEPVVSIIVPSDPIISSGITTNSSVSAELNWTVQDTTLSSCWYNNGTGGENITVGCGLNATFTLPFGEYKFYVYANDSLSNIGSDSFSVQYTAKVLENSQTYDNSTFIGSLETFLINVTFNSTHFINSEGKLFYNNTEYLGTKIGTGDTIQFSKTLEIENVNVESNMSFYWEIRLSNSTGTYLFNSTLKNQSVEKLSLDDCSTYGVLILNFSLIDEETQIILPTTAIVNSSVEIDIQLHPLGSTSQIINYTQNYSRNNNPQFCLQDLNSTYELYAQVKYGAEGYATEYFHIQNSTLNNGTIPNNINLFDLVSTSSQAFKIVFKDSNFLPVEDALIQIQRKYISEGVFKTIEIPKTDTQGETIGHFKTNDAIYTIIVTKNGKLLAGFNNVRAVCQNPSLDNCLISLNSITSAISPDDYTVGDDFTYSFTYSPTTRTIEATYTIPSGNSGTVTLNVTLFDGLGTTEVCADILVSSSGILSCVVPTSFGNGTVIAKLSKYASPRNIVGQVLISLEMEPEDLYGTSIVFIALFLMISLIGIGIGDDPKIMGFFIILGAGLLIAFNLVDTGVGRYISGGATLMWLIIAVIIIVIKGAKRT